MIKKVDHLVITTQDIKASVQFYQSLGFVCQESAGRWEYYAGDFKINVHLLGYELEPKALHVQTGSMDLCLEVDEELSKVTAQLMAQGIPLCSDLVVRHGVLGRMHSIYLRDPDGNLIELCNYNKDQ